MRALLVLVFLAACGGSTEASDSASSTDAVSAPTPIRQTLRTEIATRIAKEKMRLPAYFFVGFGYEGASNPASESHTFASFVSVDAGGDQTWSTISWLPTTFKQTQSICVFANFGEATKDTILGNPCDPVAGTDYDLTSTLGWAVAGDRTLGVWGPYHVTKDLYDLGQQRIAFLQSGAVDYLADDRDTRKDGTEGTAFNCMHAVSDLSGHFYTESFLDRFAYGNWGLEGTTNVMKHYQSMSALFEDAVDPSQFRKFSNR